MPHKLLHRSNLVEKYSPLVPSWHSLFCRGCYDTTDWKVIYSFYRKTCKVQKKKCSVGLTSVNVTCICQSDSAQLLEAGHGLCSCSQPRLNSLLKLSCCSRDALGSWSFSPSCKDAEVVKVLKCWYSLLPPASKTHENKERFCRRGNLEKMPALY